MNLNWNIFSKFSKNAVPLSKKKEIKKENSQNFNVNGKRIREGELEEGLDGNTSATTTKDDDVIFVRSTTATVTPSVLSSKRKKKPIRLEESPTTTLKEQDVTVISSTPSIKEGNAFTFKLQEEEEEDDDDDYTSQSPLMKIRIPSNESEVFSTPILNNSDKDKDVVVLDQEEDNEEVEDHLSIDSFSDDEDEEEVFNDTPLFPLNSVLKSVNNNSFHHNAAVGGDFDEDDDDMDSASSIDFDTEPILSFTKDKDATVTTAINTSKQQQQFNKKVNALDKLKRTRLFKYVGMTPKLESVRLLLKNGAIIHHQDYEGLTCVHLCALHGNLEILKVLLSHENQSTGKRIIDLLQLRTYSGHESVLHCAVDGGCLNVVELLVMEYGCNCNEWLDANHKSCLQIGREMYRDEYDRVKKLEREQIVKVMEEFLKEVEQFKQEQKLWDMLTGEDFKFVQKWLRAGYDANDVKDGKSLLYYSVELRNMELIELLLMYKADPLQECCSFDGGDGDDDTIKESPYDLAKRMEFGAAIELFDEHMSKYANDPVVPNTASNNVEQSTTIKRFSAEKAKIFKRYHQEDVEQLKKSTSKNAAAGQKKIRMKSGRVMFGVASSPIEATNSNQSSTALNDNFLSNVKNNTLFAKETSGWSILHYLINTNRKKEVHKLLLSSSSVKGGGGGDGLNVDAVDNLGYSALHLACMNGHHHFVVLLLQKGADVNKLSNTRESPLHLACENDHFRIVKLLLKSGADPDYANYRRLIPEEVTQNEEILKLIQQYRQYSKKPKCKKYGDSITTDFVFDDRLPATESESEKVLKRFQYYKDPMWSKLYAYRIQSTVPSLDNLLLLRRDLQSLQLLPDDQKEKFMKAVEKQLLLSRSEYYILDIHIARYFNYLSLDEFYKDIDEELKIQNKPVVRRLKVTFDHLKFLLMNQPQNYIPQHQHQMKPKNVYHSALMHRSLVNDYTNGLNEWNLLSLILNQTELPCNLQLNQLSMYSGVLDCMHTQTLKWIPVEDLIYLIFPLFHDDDHDILDGGKSIVKCN